MVLPDTQFSYLNNDKVLNECPDHYEMPSTLERLYIRIDYDENDTLYHEGYHSNHDCVHHFDRGRLFYWSDDEADHDYSDMQFWMHRTADRYSYWLYHHYSLVFRLCYPVLYRGHQLRNEW